MPKWLAHPNIIRDEIPSPADFIGIQYKGPNPLRVWKELDPLIKRIWEAKGSGVYAPDFRWDTTTDPRPFFIQMFAEKAFDNFTKYRVDIKLQGSQPTDPKKDGVLRVELHGFVETNFTKFSGKDQFKMLYPMFYHLYNRMFYNKIRRRYVEWHRRRIEKLAQEIRAILNIPAKPTGQSEMFMEE